MVLSLGLTWPNYPAHGKTNSFVTSLIASFTKPWIKHPVAKMHDSSAEQDTPGPVSREVADPLAQERQRMLLEQELRLLREQGHHDGPDRQIRDEVEDKTYEEKEQELSDYINSVVRDGAPFEYKDGDADGEEEDVVMG